MADNYELTILSFIHSKHLFKDDENRKKRLVKYQMENMLRRTARMFTWIPLNEEGEKFFLRIPTRVLELNIQTRGLTGIIKHSDGFYYQVQGSLGGIPNYNYMPSDYIVSNPFLGIAGQSFHIYDDKNVVIIPNDSLYKGLLDILSFHSELLTEINLTKLCVMINQRAPSILTAPDNNAKADLDDFLKDLRNGRLASVFDKNFIKSIQALDLNSNSSHNIITQILEMEQYQKASLFNDIGLQMNYNMKRETITSSEAQLGEGSLLPLCDDMLEMRKFAAEELKELWGIELSVDFSSSWKDMRQSIENEIIKEQKEADSAGGVQELDNTEAEENNDQEEKTD